MLEGIDLSVANDSIYTHDDDVDFEKVYHEGGKRYASFKATEAEHYVDPQFLAFVDRASKTGLWLNAYTFAREDENPDDDVEAFLAATKSVQGKLVGAPLFDFETRTKGMSAQQSVDFVCGWARKHISERGCGMILYSYLSFLQNLIQELGGVRSAGAFALVQFPLHLAQYTTGKPSLKGLPWDPANGGIGWTFHQYAASDPKGPIGSCPGVKGACDLSRFNGDDLSWLSAR